MRTVVRSIVIAEAIVGCTLTLAILFGERDPSGASAPLLSIGAILVLYSLVSGSWVRVPGRIEGPGMVENARRQLDADRTRAPRWVRLSRMADRHRIAVQWGLTGLLLLGTGWLLMTC